MAILNVFGIFLVLPCNVYGLTVGDTERIESSNWVQRGSDILGELSSMFGHSIDTSFDASKVVIGEPGYDDLASEQGRVTFHEWDTSLNDYSQSSTILNGQTPHDLFGYRVQFSADANVFAVSAPAGDWSGLIDCGKVYIYRLINSNYSQIGNTLTATEAVAYARFGEDLSLSEDGTTLAIGEIGEMPRGKHLSSIGRAHVYNLDSSSYNLLATIVGDEIGDMCGWSVSVSSKGEMLAIGCPFYGIDISGIDEWLTETGRVKIFKREGLSYNFKQNLDGTSPGAKMGLNVKLSGNYQVLATGGFEYDPTYTSTYSTNSDHGAVWIFELFNTNYSLRGSIIEGANAGDNFGHSLAITHDGNRLVVNAPQSDTNKQNEGSVYVYDLNNSNTILSKTFYGKLESHLGGRNSANAVAMSASGNILMFASDLSNPTYLQIFEDLSYTAYPSNMPSQVPSSAIPSTSPSDFPSELPTEGCHPKCNKLKQCYGSNLWIRRCKVCNICKMICLKRCRARRCLVGRWEQKCRGCSFC